MTDAWRRSRPAWIALEVTLLACSPPSRVTDAPVPRMDVSSASSAQCEWTWSDALDLRTVDGRPAYVESPTIARTSDGMLLVGTPSFFWATPHSFDPPPGPTAADTAEYVGRLQRNHSFVGLLADDAMRVSGVRFPEGLRGLVEHASVFSDDRSGVHLLWQNPQGDSTALWHSRREAGRWSAPRQLMSASRIDWQFGDARAGGGLHVVVPYARSGREAGIAYFHLGGDVPRRVLRAHGGFPRYASVLPFGGDSLLVAFTALGDMSEMTAGRQIFVISAAVSDTVWPTPRRLVVSASRIASWPRLFADSSPGAGRRVGLLWLSAAPGATASDSIHVAMSGDAGASWPAVSSAQLPAGASHVTAASGAGGGIHAVIQSRGGAAAVHVHWRDGAWRTIEQRFAGLASRATLSVAAPDSLLLVWGVEKRSRIAAPEMPDAPASRHAWLTRTCR